MKEGWTSLHKTIREINLVFKGLKSVAVLQAIKNWMVGRPGNEATTQRLTTSIR